jgi:arsenite/tail-anchored protein-transporting ATPase
VHHLLDRRILFFGGKGGVGKTTCAAALALGASQRGRRVLLVSTDPAHSTSDVFERTLGPDEHEIRPGLFGIEIDAEIEARRYLDQVRVQVGALFGPAVLKEALRQMELAATMPGVSDVALFDRMAEIVRTRSAGFDLVIFDTAPTGHTLRLLQMPELMATWIRALSARRREAVRAAETVRGPTSEAPAADPVLASLDSRARRLEQVRAALSQTGTTAIVLVLLPERLPIEETARALSLLEHMQMPVEGLVINRVLPDLPEGDFLRARKAQERVYLEEIERRFSGLPRVIVPQLERDVHGFESLQRIAERLLE